MADTGALRAPVSNDVRVRLSFAALISKCELKSMQSLPRKQVKLSIVVIAYNEEEYLRQCLEAIKQQLYPPEEVIVVNNNSTDKTVKIAQSFPFVKLIHEKEQGMIPARNAGFDAAKGDLLARIDADTRPPVDWVVRVHKILDNQVDT